MKEKTWLWCHPTGAHDGRWNLPASSATPGEALRYLGIENAIYVVFKQYSAAPLRSPRRRPERGAPAGLVVGDTSSDRNDDRSDLEPALELARDCPNLTGAITNDFFLSGRCPAAPACAPPHAHQAHFGPGLGGTS